MLRLVTRPSVRTGAIVLSTILLGACADGSADPASPDEPLLSRGRGGKRVVDSVAVIPPEAVVSHADTVVVGTPTQFTALAFDGRGHQVQKISAKWLARGGAAKVTDDGVVQTADTGTVVVTADVDGVTSDYTIVSVPSGSGAPAAPPETPPVSTPTSIAAAVFRFDGGSGSTVVSSGVPLAPGVLRPGQEGSVRVLVAGTEQPAYVAGLKSLHQDGSLRAVLVQLRATVAAGQPVEARVELGTARSAANTVAAPLAPTASVPGAALLPTDPAALVASGVVGETRTAADTRAMGDAFARYDADFATYADVQWTATGDHWEGNYYDRAMIYYAMWARTGKAEYWARATRLAYAYRRDYVEAQGYSAAPHWAMMEGLEKHYLLTGDEASRVAVVRVAEMYTAYLPEYYTPSGGDVRIMARFIHGALLAWRLTPGGDTPAGTSPRDWAARLEFLLERSRTWQQADGGYPAAVTCNTTMNYQVGLLNDALIQVHTYYRADPTIVAQVKRSADYLWGTQWIAWAQSFAYLSGSCAGVGAFEPAVDLTGMLVGPFGWLARQTGDGAYRTVGDQVFSAAVTNAYLVGSKQFNQAYTNSFRYLAWR